MSISSQISRISGNVSAAFSAITNKGVTVPAGSNSDDLADLISQISGGGSGTAIIVDTQDSHGGTIRSITTTSEVSLQANKTVTPTASVQTILPDSGYDGLAQVTVNAGGGGGAENEIIARTISGTYTNSEVTNIGRYAFASCTLLNQVSFPNASLIDNYALAYCSDLTSVYAPSVTYISNAAFYLCRKLSQVTFGNVTTISNGAFNYCVALASFNFSSVTSLGTGAFSNTGLISVELPIYSVDIPSSAFANCSSLISFSASSALTVQSSAFTSCYSLETLCLPTVNRIGSSAFTYCSNLKTVSLPLASIIQTNAFASCSSMSTVILNHSSTARGLIEQYAFNRCTSLISIYLLASMCYGLGATNTFAYTPLSTSTTLGYFGSIFVPESLYDGYKASTTWSNYAARFASLTDAQISNVLASGTHL